MPVHYDDAVVSAIAALDEVGARVYMHAGTYRAELPLPSRADGHAGLGRAYISIYAGDLPGTVHLYADLPDGDSLLEKEDARPGDVVAYWRDATEAARDAAHRVADEAVIRRDARLIAKGVWEDTCAGYAAAAEDPADPVPTQGGQMLMGPPESAGPHDQRDVEARDDVAVFTGPPLAEPVTVLGPVRLRAWVSADAVDAHLHAALTEVLPDGASVLLTDGVLRLSARRGTDRRDPLTPGVAVEVEVDMWATGVHVPAGHRLRLDLAGSCWPRYDVADPAGGAPVKITVHHDAARPSALLLPLVDLAALGRDRS